MSKDKKLYTSTFTFDGRRYYVRSAKSQRDADKRASVKLAELESGRVVLSSFTLVSTYMTEWLTTYQEPTVSTAVFQAQKSLIDRLVIPNIGNLRLQDVRPLQLQKIINSQTNKSKNYYVKLRNLLKSVFSQAVKDRLLIDSPADKLELPKSTDGTHRSLTSQERNAVLYTADWHSFGLFVQTCLWCGLRPQEAAALRWEDIDQINHRIHIVRALKADGSIGETKSSAGRRIIPIPPQLWIRLIHRIPCSGYVTIIQSTLSPDLTLYCMRHTYCTDLQAAGIPINVARDLMGHSDISLTAKIYTHMRDDIMDEAASKIAAFGATQGATQIWCKALQTSANNEDYSAPKKSFMMR